MCPFDTTLFVDVALGVVVAASVVLVADVTTVVLGASSGSPGPSTPMAVILTCTMEREVRLWAGSDG